MLDKKTELKKYLDKKKKQKTRDRLMEEIAALSNKSKMSSPAKLVKTKINKMKTRSCDSFEKGLFRSDEKACLLTTQRIDDSDTLALKCCTNQEIQPEGEHRILTEAIQNDILDSSTEKDMKGHQTTPELRNEKAALKNHILDLKEVFEIKRCEQRLSAIQEQRQKLDIFYDESEIVSSIKYNLITFIQGETGCGKTTQIPQFLLENGFACKGMIGITQPRRFAAVSIACRLNTEMNENLSGFKIKYENTITSQTRIKVMTEGILFREIQSDFLLREYSVIILDEVHERSVNMDILIGMLTKIVKIRLSEKNPLRLVLMSATVDTGDFKHVLGEFNVLSLNSKMFKVNVFYEDKTPDEYLDASYNKILGILEAEKMYKTNKKSRSRRFEIPNEIENTSKASILVFLPSKDDIYLLKDRLDSLNKSLAVLPLHSSLSKNDQNRVYLSYSSRKIVLATNIAETSTTIDDVVFVIDSGRVKHKIMDQNTVLYRIDMISKSSARQRMGRAGRTKAGVCYRIYSGDTYESLVLGNVPQIFIEPFDPYLLQLKCMGVQNIFSFPFIDMPSECMVTESLESLRGIGAIDGDGNVSKLGKKMCRYPVLPKYACLLLFNSRHDIAYKLAIVVSILASGWELKKNERTQGYFTSEKSDLIVSLKIVLDYLKSPTRRLFSESIGISFDRFEEIRKLSSYLMKLSGESSFSTEIDHEEADEICRAIYYVFSSQLAINSGSSYLYKNGDIFVSNDSIYPDNQNIVFDSISCGKSRSYAKNITVICPEWFRS